MAGLGLRASQGPCHWLQIETPLFSDWRVASILTKQPFIFQASNDDILVSSSVPRVPLLVSPVTLSLPSSRVTAD